MTKRKATRPQGEQPAEIRRLMEDLVRLEIRWQVGEAFAPLERKLAAIEKQRKGGSA